MSKPKEKGEEVVTVLIEYNFPEHGITVRAVDLEDAMRQLGEILKSNKV